MVTTRPVSPLRSMRWRPPSKASSTPSWMRRSRARRSPTPASANRVDRALLEQTGADAGAQILGRATLQYGRFDPGQSQQARQQQPGRSAADDSDLCAHGQYALRQEVVELGVLGHERLDERA